MNHVENVSNHDQYDESDDDGLTYLVGFGNELESSCLPGALPMGRNNPREVPYGLYTEQISGTAFTKPRSAHNKRTWLYRIQPSVVGSSSSMPSSSPPTQPNDANQQEEQKEQQSSQSGIPPPPPQSSTSRRHCYFGHAAPHECEPVVDPLRWFPPPPPASMIFSESNRARRITFVEGCRLMCHGGSVEQKHGLAIYMYQFDANMMVTGTTTTTTTTKMENSNPDDENGPKPNHNECLYNADGEFLLVPQQGGLEIITEMGKLRVRPKEIAVIPRGIVFSVQLLPSSSARRSGSKHEQQPTQGDDEIHNDATTTHPMVAQGYLLEVYGGDGFQLPDLGPIGANGLANARDFQYPTAWTTMTDPTASPTAPFHTWVKMQSRLFSSPSSSSTYSPYNVVAWHGNYLPYKYPLSRFCAMNSVSYDHCDPSIFTVLTCPSHIIPGTALADFVVFPPRFLATDSNTFRPPYFHRNTMSEYMGLICGQYEGKTAKTAMAAVNDNNNGKNKNKNNISAFVPGGASLHNCMTPHGPDRQAYQTNIIPYEEDDNKDDHDDDGAEKWQETSRAQRRRQRPLPPQPVVYLDKGMAFMFETYLTLTVPPTALYDESWRDWNYAHSSWSGLEPSSYFSKITMMAASSIAQERTTAEE